MHLFIFTVVVAECIFALRVKYTYTHIHTHMYIYTHAHTHTHTVPTNKVLGLPAPATCGRVQAATFDRPV
jgi:hypothetical protein